VEKSTVYRILQVLYLSMLKCNQMLQKILYIQTNTLFNNKFIYDKQITTNIFK